MSSSIAQSIDALCKEHNLDRELIIEAMKDAVRAAARKQYKTSDKNADSIQVDWNNEEGMVEVSATKTVVEEVENSFAEISLEEAVEMAGEEVEIGDMLLIPLPTEELGRIAAQTAKQILVQKVREAVREQIYDQYIDKKGDLINGTVKRFERGEMIVDLGSNLEAVLPKRQQVRAENWNQGERIRVVIHDVNKDPKGPQLIGSRTSPELLIRLFEMEVPEIYDETVVIKSAVREPGDRAKIAVASNERDVDPVGACVGMKGSRVQSIIRELRGEKIDIIEWSEEPSVFAANALAPAKVSQVRILDIDKRKMEVIVTEDQLSLAIGKHGQNVRLATKLVGWNIDIRNEEELKKEIAKQMGRMMASGGVVPITALEVVTPAQAEDLKQHGIDDIEKLAAVSVDDLVDWLDLSLDDAEKIQTAAQSALEARNYADENSTDENEASEEDLTADNGQNQFNDADENDANAENDSAVQTEEENRPELDTDASESADAQSFDTDTQAQNAKGENADA